MALAGGMSVRKTAAKFEVNPSTVRVVPVVGDGLVVPVVGAGAVVGGGAGLVVPSSGGAVVG